MQTMCKYMFNVHFVNFAQFHLPNPSLFGNAFKVTVTKSGPQHTSATVLYAAEVHVQEVSMFNGNQDAQDTIQQKLQALLFKAY